MSLRKIFVCALLVNLLAWPIFGAETSSESEKGACARAVLSADLEALGRCLSEAGIGSHWEPWG
jgi:hypothetical protein